MQVLTAIKPIHTTNRRMRVLAMELETEGHHPSYVRNFAKTWLEHEIPGDLDFLVSHKFYQRHPDVVAYVRSLTDHGLRIHSISDAEEKKMESNPYLRYFHGWKLFCQYAKSLNCDHGLLMYSDFFQLPMLVSQRSPCPFSIIYFRPTYHYQKLSNYQPSWKGKFRAARKKWLIARVLKLPKLERVYCLDTLAIEYMKQYFKTKASIEFLPDSFAIEPVTASRVDLLRSELGIDKSRKIFCLVGVLDRRKGVRELLEAAMTIPESDGKRICVLLVGKLQSDQEPEILALLKLMKQSSAIQVLLLNEFVPDTEIQKYYELSDVILTTYQKHMGASSALIRAALAKRPVLSSDYGLMGEIVRRRQMGLTIDTTQPKEIARGILAFLEDRPEYTLNQQYAAEMVQENSSARLAAALRNLII